MRDSGAYLKQAKDWPEFCQNFLRMSYDTANRLIRLLNQFGAPYFTVAQLTRLSPETYRAIAPSIRGEELHHHGEAIALLPENADKITAAIAEIRKQSAPKALPAPKESAVERLDRRCGELAREIEAMLRENPQAARLVLYGLRQRVDALERTI
jgi:hypothetical protein